MSGEQNDANSKQVGTPRLMPKTFCICRNPAGHTALIETIITGWLVVLAGPGYEGNPSNFGRACVLHGCMGLT
jgi:hypothetical protein